MPRLVTARALVLGAVVLLAFVLVYPTAQSYLAQRAKLNATERSLADEQARRAELDNELERWSDPAYVTSQARSRLSFVLPGERAFRVVDPETASDEPDLGDGPVTTSTWSGRAWYADVWTSVKVAGQAG